MCHPWMPPILFILFSHLAGIISCRKDKKNYSVKSALRKNRETLPNLSLSRYVGWSSQNSQTSWPCMGIHRVKGQVMKCKWSCHTYIVANTVIAATAEFECHNYQNIHVILVSQNIYPILLVTKNNLTESYPCGWH